MPVYILTDPKNKGGVQTWINDIQKHIYIKKIFYDINFTIPPNSILCINNYTNNDFYIKYKKRPKDIKIYFVLHSDICPSNEFFVNNKDIFDGVICVSKYIIEKVCNLLPHHEKIYIPNKDNYIKNKITKNTNDTFKITYVGRLSYEKNLPMLFDAISKLQKLTDIKIMLNVYGDYSHNYGLYLKNYVSEFNLDSFITFKNYESNKEIIYSNTDCVILTSVHEGYPYCLIEANKYNINILSSNFSKLEYHFDEKCLYKYEGLNLLDYYNTLYIQNYKELLKKIGYIEIILQKKIPNTLFNKIKYLHNNIINEKILIPPHFVNKYNTLYDKNVNIICDKILELIKQKD